VNEPPDTDPAAHLLARIRPAALRPELLERLRAAAPRKASDTGSCIPRRWRIVLPRVAAAAAVIAAVAFVARSSLPQRSPEGIVRNPDAPAEAAAAFAAEVRADDAPGVAMAAAPLPMARHIRRQLLGVKDLGISRDDRDRPVRLMHATWLDEEGGADASPESAARGARVRDEIVPVVLTIH
jgi:hypothetical protein